MPFYGAWQEAGAGGPGDEAEEDSARSTECPECGVVIVKESSWQSNAMSCDCGCDFCFNCLICFRTALDDPRESFQEHYQDEVRHICLHEKESQEMTWLSFADRKVQRIYNSQ